MRWVGDMGILPFKLTEKMNRYNTFIASYRLEAQARGLKPGAEFDETSFAQSMHAVRETQAEYAKWNRFELARGRKGVFLLFQSFVANQIGMVFQGRNNFRLRYLAALGLAGGATALPFAKNIMDLVDALIAYTGDEFSDVEQELREYVGSVSNAETADLLIHGYGRDMFGLGVDISGAISMGRVLPLTEVARKSTMGLEDTRAASESISDIGGAGTGAVMNLWRAAYDDNPDTFKRWIRAMPAFMKGPAKALEMAQNEGVLLGGGALLPGSELDMSNSSDRADVLAQSLGFISTQNSVSWGKYIQQAEYGKYIIAKRISLSRDWRHVQGKEDREGLADVNKAIAAFNKDAPPLMRLTTDALVKGVVAAARGNAMKEAGLPSQLGLVESYLKIGESFPSKTGRQPLKEIGE